MRPLSFAFLFSAFAAALVGAQTNANPFNIPPSGNYLLNAGQPTTFTWSPTTSGTITLTLRDGPNGDLNPGTVIQSGLPNSGSYTYTPPSNTVEGNTYTIEISSDSDPTQVNYTPQFDILSPVKAVPSGSASASTPSNPASSSTPTSTNTATTLTTTVTSSAATASASSTTAAASASASSSGTGTSNTVASATTGVSSSSSSGTASATASSNSPSSSTTSASSSITSVASTNGGAGLKAGSGVFAMMMGAVVLAA